MQFNSRTNTIKLPVAFHDKLEFILGEASLIHRIVPSGSKYAAPPGALEWLASLLEAGSEIDLNPAEEPEAVPMEKGKRA